MIVGCTLDYYIIYVLLLKVTTKGKGWYIICKKKNKNKLIIKWIDIQVYQNTSYKDDATKLVVSQV
jgi:hypothetical protein